MYMYIYSEVGLFETPKVRYLKILSSTLRRILKFVVYYETPLNKKITFKNEVGYTRYYFMITATECIIY